MLDGHFVIEHSARNRSGRFFNFNGTAGIWRREAIETSGGWEHDTLTEDLDLSYRAQLKGWKFVFAPKRLLLPKFLWKSIHTNLSNIAGQKVPFKLPRRCCHQVPNSQLAMVDQIGSILSFHQQYFIFIDDDPVLVYAAITCDPIRKRMAEYYDFGSSDFPDRYFVSALFLYFVAERNLSDWILRIRYIPFLMSLGIGLSVNNSKAVLEALFGYQTEFKRTPKYCIEKNSDNWQHKKYRVSKSAVTVIELVFAVYFAFTIYYAIVNGFYFSVPFLMLFLFGFSYMGLTSFIQANRKWVMLKRPVANAHG